MNTFRPNATFRDCTGHIPDPIQTNQDGWGNFLCGGQSTNGFASGCKHNSRTVHPNTQPASPVMSDFTLSIQADTSKNSAELRLLDQHGGQQAYQFVDFTKISASHRHGLFDLRGFLDCYVDPGQEAVSIAEIGICIAEEVLGTEIFEKLWAGSSPRTLRISLPGAVDADNHLAAALTRVPWEIARLRKHHETLADRHVLVRIVHEQPPSASRPIPLDPGQELRVLFVFAEAKDAQPLGARQERRALLALFEKEIYPQYRVVAHFLTHGVTRERLTEQITDHNGYHVVHWSGHGHRNLLQLCRPDGASDLLSGGELLKLFLDAGGYLPQVMFLSACHSGDILRVEDWPAFIALAQGQKPGNEALPVKELDLEHNPGFTGTAHALLQGGVPTVVAMRYAVGDDYARELAVEYYRALLAHPQPKTTDMALTLARQKLQKSNGHHALCDHATPVLYGEIQPVLARSKGRSSGLNSHDPLLHRIHELSPAAHTHFVGRTWELVGLGAEFIGAKASVEAKPVAQITGLGGMGKSALVAEALALWQSRFTWVLLYQAKPQPLGFEAMLRDIHMELNGRLELYHQHIQAHPADAIYRDATTDFTGQRRLQQLSRNLLRAMQAEAILLVLDNFETNLKPQPEANAAPGQPVWACQDPAWDHCLKLLVTELVGTPSRLLLTSRRPLAALAETGCHSVRLGPLPPAEAALYLRAHPTLRQMLFADNPEEWKLARRLLHASRFHPLLLDRLTKLATNPSLRPQLLQALQTLETTREFKDLPGLFATTANDAQELAYLDDALTLSIDQLLHDAGANARRVLWMIALANEPVERDLLQGVWSGESPKLQHMRQIKALLEILPQLPEELRAKLQAMPPELRAQLEHLPPEPPPHPDLAPLVQHLQAIGLATTEQNDATDPNPAFSCHELVRERITQWMSAHPGDRQEFSETAIRLAYAGWLEMVFKALQHQNMSAALQAGSRALVYCVQAAAWERLGGFASRLVTSIQDPALLAGLIPHLQTAAESAPEGKPRWSCLCNLADALGLGGRPDLSLIFFEQAADQARQAANSSGAQQAWSDLAVILGNWANALGDVGQLDVARRKYLESAEVGKQAGLPAIRIIGSELEALRIAIMQGKVTTALPEIERRLEQVQTWWRQNRAGQTVVEAPDTEFLARVLLGGLDIAQQADDARQDWDSALQRLDLALTVKKEMQRPAQDIGATRFNRANVLVEFENRRAEAKAELEACLALFEHQPNLRAKVLSSLSDVFDEQGDLPQAILQERRALALCESLPDPADRAISHGNLANYLGRSETPADQAASPSHELAALLYFLVAGLGQHLQTSFKNYAVRFRRAQEAGQPLAILTVAQLLADPAFDPLRQWLNDRQVDRAELQVAVDQFLQQVRQAAMAQAQ